jgi:hypothetical protein
MVIKSKIRWSEYVACMERLISAYKIFVWKPEGTRTLGRPRRSWKNITIEFKDNRV